MIAPPSGSRLQIGSVVFTEVHTPGSQQTCNGRVIASSWKEQLLFTVFSRKPNPKPKMRRFQCFSGLLLWSRRSLEHRLHLPVNCAMKGPEGKLRTMALLRVKRLEAEGYLRRAYKPWSVLGNASVTQGGEQRTGPNLGRQSRMWPQRYLSLYCSESEDGGGLVCGDVGHREPNWVVFCKCYSIMSWGI